MKAFKIIGLAVAGAFAVMGTAANAQATRTWVSGVGDDVNPCSRTAPCKTFAGAISKTAAGGEINCLDPGGFGAVTITKAMTINCIYTEGGVLAGGNGIVVNAGVNDVVYLRGLDIFGVNPPTNGVRIIAGGAVHIESSTIRRFNAANSFGISFQPGGATRLYLNDVTIAENGSGATGGGVLIQPTGTGSANVSFRNVRIRNNANNGLNINTTGNTGTGISLVLQDIEVSGNSNGISVTQAVGTAAVAAMLTDSTIANNAGFGITANGGSITMRVGNTTITGNAAGVSQGGGALVNTFGTNRLFGNPAIGAPNNGTFSGAIIPQN